jgi:hypothetical protein
MYSNTAVRASVFVGQDWRWIRSFFSDAWKLSIAALSKQSPRDPWDTFTPILEHRVVNSRDVYCPDSSGPRNSV